MLNSRPYYCGVTAFLVRPNFGCLLMPTQRELATAKTEKYLAQKGTCTFDSSTHDSDHETQKFTPNIRANDRTICHQLIHPRAAESD